VDDIIPLWVVNALAFITVFRKSIGESGRFDRSARSRSLKGAAIVSPDVV
jgi:hypothetical protein